MTKIEYNQPICQREHTNHTRDTVQKLMVLEHVSRQKLDVPFWSDVAIKAVKKSLFKQNIPLKPSGIFF